MLARTSYSTEQEQEAELLATLIAGSVTIATRPLREREARAPITRPFAHHARARCPGAQSMSAIPADVAMLTAAGMTGVGSAYKALGLRGERRDPATHAVVLSLASLAASSVLFTPSVYRFGSTGSCRIVNLCELLGHAFVLAAGWHGQRLLLHLTGTATGSTCPMARLGRGRPRSPDSSCSSRSIRGRSRRSTSSRSITGQWANTCYWLALAGCVMFQLADIGSPRLALRAARPERVDRHRAGDCHRRLRNRHRRVRRSAGLRGLSAWPGTARRSARRSRSWLVRDVDESGRGRRDDARVGEGAWPETRMRSFAPTAPTGSSDRCGRCCAKRCPASR